MSDGGGSGPVSLGARADALDRLGSRTFDLLVIGGGITGAGIALDAATRGLSVALVEAQDFASGTSSRSSKLVHGGLRYLEQGEIGLVRQSARERELLRRLAPHLVRAVPFVLPKGPAAESLLMRAGLIAYDLLAGVDRRYRHRSVSRREAAELAAGIEARTGAFVYHDCGTDDSRLVIEVLRAACRAGAVVCNHVEAVHLIEVAGRAAGCEVRDTIGAAAMPGSAGSARSAGGVTIKVRAADVVNATGVWADGVRRMEDAEACATVRPSKGIHLVLPRTALPLDAACLIPVPARRGQRGRRIFAVPWRSSVVVGPTDTDYEGPLAAPSVEGDEADGLLEALSQAFARSFDRSVVVGAFAGLRPLVSGAGGSSAAPIRSAGPGGSAGPSAEPPESAGHGGADGRHGTTRDLSRRHVLTSGRSGMVTITGGKLTTYRHMAEETVDLVVGHRGSSVTSVTARTPLLNLPDGDLRELSHAVAKRVEALGLDPGEAGVAASLVLSYGDRASAVLDLAEAEGLSAPLVPGLPYLEAEIVWGAREEMGATAEDLLARRTRVSLEDPAGGLTGSGGPERLMGLLASALGVSRQEADGQLRVYRQALAHERGPSIPVRDKSADPAAG